MENLDGKVVVITGGANGIGLAMARSFAAAGAKLALGDINEDELDTAVAELADGGTDVIGVPIDVSDFAQVEALRDAAVSTFGTVHVVCNNAGVAGGGACWDIPLEQWDWVLGIDLYGVIHGIKAFTKLFIDQGEGHIVNTASMAGLLSPGFTATYNVAKHGVVTLSETLFSELSLAAPAVGVSVLCPGWVNTRIYDAARYTAVGAPDVPEQVDAGDDASGADNASEGGEQAPPSMQSIAKSLVTSGIDPAEVGDLVVEAVRENRFYILTHPTWTPLITDRSERMVDGRGPVSSLLPGLD